MGRLDCVVAVTGVVQDSVRQSHQGNVCAGGELQTASFVHNNGRNAFSIPIYIQCHWMASLKMLEFN